MKIMMVSTDSFHNRKTGKKNIIRYNNTTYIIDVNGDDKWDYIYDIKTGKTEGFYEYIELKLTQGFKFIYILIMIAAVLIVLRRRKH